MIEHDHPQRKHGETLFLIPFNKDNRAVAFDEILSTLNRLADVKPLLFLNSLSEIEWNAEESNGRYSLMTSGVFGSGLDLRYETIKGEEKTEDHYWKFERAIEGGSELKAAVVYHVDDENIVSTTTIPAICIAICLRPTNALFLRFSMLHSRFPTTERVLKLTMSIIPE